MYIHAHAKYACVVNAKGESSMIEWACLSFDERFLFMITSKEGRTIFRSTSPTNVPLTTVLRRVRVQ